MTTADELQQLRAEREGNAVAANGDAAQHWEYLTTLAFDESPYHAQRLEAARDYYFSLSADNERLRARIAALEAEKIKET